MSHQEMPLFTRTFDFLAWLLPATHHFPRVHRHDFTHRLLSSAFDFVEQIEEANHRKGPARQERLAEADESLDKLRTYLRLASRWGWFSAGQYEHVAGMVAEMGRLLGGWKKV